MQIWDRRRLGQARRKDRQRPKDRPRLKDRQRLKDRLRLKGQTATEDLMTIIENNPDLSAYAQALKASGNDQKLTGGSPTWYLRPPTKL